MPLPGAVTEPVRTRSWRAGDRVTYPVLRRSRVSGWRRGGAAPASPTRWRPNSRHRGCLCTERVPEPQRRLRSATVRVCGRPPPNALTRRAFFRLRGRGESGRDIDGARPAQAGPAPPQTLRRRAGRVHAVMRAADAEGAQALVYETPNSRART